MAEAAVGLVGSVYGGLGSGAALVVEYGGATGSSTPIKEIRYVRAPQGTIR